MKYRKVNGKYQTTLTVCFYLPAFEHHKGFTSDWYWMGQGVLYIEKGFIWDGTSGPTIDTPNTMVPGLIHDALYRAIRDGHLSPADKDAADKVLLEYMSRIPTGGSSSWWRTIRARYFYTAVKLCGHRSIRPTRPRSLSAT